ncbi:hemolysin III family protein [Pseudenhygromyxa sp. WMMC2535]|uniref:PAQR family membrane homeostasis protein TrhA n=1 Tax=Pseudenhygromyxa sp. WMMC2535 TaxID=2712867 RepID=UPI0015559006|nr:hemolysin III family protein [Pseudenhygromyxa sp. WMMC2535]
MSVATQTAEGKFSRSEELANALSAGAGMLLSLVALTAMVSSVSDRDFVHIASALVFGTSLLAVYVTSLFNHALPAGRAKEFFHIADLASIYLLIAGTYTPITLLALHNDTGNAMFIAIWTMAVIGCTRKLLAPNAFEDGLDRLSVVSYVVMGWMVLAAPAQCLAAMPTKCVLWLLGGGALYTTGVLFFRMTKLRYHHLVWHLFVIAGSACHVFAVHYYVLPIATP